MPTEFYYLYFDDSGNRFPDKPQEEREDGMNHFALGGILIKDEDRGPVIEQFKDLQRKWEITYPLRSTDIRGKRDNFIWLSDEKINKEFLDDLSKFLNTIPVIGFAAVIDRIGYNNRYEEVYGDERWWMCKTAYSILIERAAKFSHNKNRRMKIRFEETGKSEDRAMMRYAKDLKDIGLPFNTTNSSKYSNLEPEDFRSIIFGAPKRQTKKSPLLQISDLYLYPMAKGGYTKSYRPYQEFMKNKQLIDALLAKDEIANLGIKYSCFDSR